MHRMKKNVFICHRPYHILRCCDMISREKNDAVNVLIVFDVKKAGINEFQRFETNKIFYSSFDEVIEIERIKISSLRNIFGFLRCCKDRMKRFMPIVNKHSDLDSLFFFCDNELEIQLLVGLYIKNAKPSLESILIDEGMVTYSRNTYTATKWVIWYSKLLTCLLGIKKFNTAWAYGASSYYNKSLANEPSRANFREPIEQLPPLSDDICRLFRSKLVSSVVIPENKSYFIYVSQPIKMMEEKELSLIKKLMTIAIKNDIAFFIKLHPMQDENPYKEKFGNSIIIEKSYPIELFYSSRVIVGGAVSSSLYNASLQGYKALDLAPLFDLPELGISQSFSWTSIRRVSDFNMFEDVIKTLTKIEKQ